MLVCHSSAQLTLLLVVLFFDRDSVTELGTHQFDEADSPVRPRELQSPQNWVLVISLKFLGREPCPSSQPGLCSMCLMEVESGKRVTECVREQVNKHWDGGGCTYRR